MRSTALGLGTLVLILAAVCPGQEEPVFHSQSNIVIVPTLVKDSNGQVVYGLGATDFSLTDDGKAQSIRLEDWVETQPVSVVVAIQIGRRAPREFPRLQGLSSVMSLLESEPGAEIAVIEFDSGVRLTKNFDDRQTSVETELKRLPQGDDGAAILDAMQFSMSLLESRPANRQRLVLLISETRDHGSRVKIENVIACVGRSNTIVHSLAFSPSISQFLDTERGSNRDEWGGSPDLLAPLMMAGQALRTNTAKTIAEMTGGEYELFASRKGAEDRLVAFTNHLHSRYLLSFEPTQPHSGLHRVKVQLRKAAPSVSVLSRSSYWAQSQSNRVQRK